MVSVQQTSLSQNMLPETVAFSPKVTITLYRTTSQCLTSYGCAITVLYVNIWYRICMELCLPLSSLNRLQLETNAINVLYIWSPIMLFRGSHHALVLHLSCKWRHGILHPAVATDLGVCGNVICIWALNSIYFSLWRYACFVRMLGLWEFPLPNCGHLCAVVQLWQDIASQWCGEQVPFPFPPGVSPASNSSYLHLVICWLWME